MKKYAAVVMMICLSASLLMGCGGSGGGEDKSSAAGSKAEAQEETAQAEEQQQGETAQAEEAQQAETGQEEAVAFEAQEEAQTDQLVSRDMPAPADGYIVFVKDANTEEPLADVRIQFCSDVQCLMGKTDNSGAAVFNVDPGNYEAHVYKPPVGYQKCSDTFKLTPDDRVAVFTLLKEGEELKAAEAADEADTAADETGDESSEEESGGLSKYDSEWSFDVTGFTFKVPERFKEYKGQYRASDRGETDFNSNMFITNILYLPRTDEEKEAEEALVSEKVSQAGNDVDPDTRTIGEIGSAGPVLDWRMILRDTVNYGVDWSMEHAVLEDGIVRPILEERPMPVNIPIDGSVKERYQRFDQTMGQFDGQDIEDVRKATEPMFGDTYFYQYYLMSDLPEY